MRRLLMLAACANIGAALAFARPDLLRGVIDLPDAPLLFRASCAYFVALFGVAYAWMSWQPVIPRVLVGFAALGKTGAFVLFLMLWLTGAMPAALMPAAASDLLFAGLFVRWLRSGRVD